MKKTILFLAVSAAAFAGAISIADHLSPEIVGTIRTGGEGLVAVAVDPLTSRAYGAHGRDNLLTVIDTRTDSVITELALGADGARGVAVDLSTPRVYVSHADGTLSVVDTSINELTHVVPVGREPGGPVVNPATGLVYVASYRDATLTVVDPSGATVATVPVGDFPSRIAVDPVNNRVYVSDIRENVTVVDGDTQEVLETLSFGGFVSGMAVDVVTERVYFALHFLECLAVVDGRTLQFEGLIRLEARPWFLAVNPDNGKVYATTGLAMSIVDGPRGSLLATVPIEGGTSWTTVNPITDRAYTVTANSGGVPSLVSVIDGRSLGLTTTLRVGSSAGGVRGIATNPLTDLTYAAESRDGVKVISGHHPVVDPGSSPEEVTLLELERSTGVPVTWLLADLNWP